MWPHQSTNQEGLFCAALANHAIELWIAVLINQALGRWSWQRFRGKHNVSLRVISAYRPCRSPGPNTVYSQHSRFFDATSDTPIQPRKQFFEDLSKEILKWKNEEHDQIVLMMDANTSTSITTDRELQEFLR